MLFFKKKESLKLSEVGNLYLEHCDVENILNFRSLAKYKRIIKWITDIIGDIDVKNIDRRVILKMKKEHKARNLKPLASAIRFTVLKNILRFCREELLMEVFDANRIKRPKIPKRKVDYLTAEELGNFFETAAYEISDSGHFSQPLFPPAAESARHCIWKLPTSTLKEKRS